MRRVVTVADVVTVAAAACTALALIGVTGCSGSSSSPTVPRDRAGTPNDTASPTGVSPPVTPTPAVSSPASGSASGSAEAALDLPGCMIGSWTAPVAREFGNLGLSARSNGAVRGATGLLSLRFTADRKWTFTYDQVKLDMAAGSVDVSGPITGAWSLDGSTLTSTIGTSSIKATMAIGGLSIGAPGAVTNVLRTLPPNQVFVRCTGGGLQFQLPTSQGGGTTTFDAA